MIRPFFDAILVASSTFFLQQIVPILPAEYTFFKIVSDLGLVGVFGFIAWKLSTTVERKEQEAKEERERLFSIFMEREEKIRAESNLYNIKQLENHYEEMQKLIRLLQHQIEKKDQGH